MIIRIITDIIFDPIKREIRKEFPMFELDVNYFEDITLGLKSFTQHPDISNEIFFIHSDQIFHRKPIEWQKSLLQSISYFIDNNISSKIIITNGFSLGFRNIELCQNTGFAFETAKVFQSDFEIIKQKGNTYFFDFHKIITNEGLENFYNYNLGILYQMPYTKKAIISFSSEFINFFKFLSVEEKKVIVLDCDNTLWGGVLGEDGIDNIKCDKNAEGIVYYNFQLFLKDLIKDGFILCLCSKNNIKEVESAFDKLNMPLKWDDFIVKMVNWESKNINIRKIAEILKLGESSFIFIDDNEFELEVVKKFTDVNTLIHFTSNYSNLISIVNNYVFKRKNILNVDRVKNLLYKQEILRTESLSNFNSIDDFVKGLEIKTEIKINDFDNLTRLSQLTEKTNQFNFNKAPKTVKELLDIIMSEGLIFSLKLSDKFGAYGTVGLIIINKVDNEYVIDNFLMSCRALGKKVENDFFKYVLDYLEIHSISITKILFQKTSKNKPAEIFLNSLNYGSIIRYIE